MEMRSWQESLFFMIEVKYEYRDASGKAFV